MKLLEKVVAREGKGIHAGESYILWSQLQARYDTLELAQFHASLASDEDFKLLVDRGIDGLIKPQIKKLEDTMNRYRIPLPTRPPRDINLPASAFEAARDESMFRIILSGSQTALLVHAKAINACTNDSLRNMFLNFFNDEAHMYDDLVKFGKIKGWVHMPPRYKH
ncbi:MAG: DUF3231 family protein [Bacillota bacterium]